MSNKFATISNALKCGVSCLTIHGLLGVISTRKNMFTASADWLHHVQNL
ncbi:hypothetical protein HMPREF9690_03711 [Raoultella ornithinolytica 10-5246]|nr:hypothetical protein HMPREF9690_03711 [Raoultella ornithinolytica 10-5246]